MSADEIRQAVLRALIAVAPEVDAAKIDADSPLREQVDIDSMELPGADPEDDTGDEPKRPWRSRRTAVRVLAGMALLLLVSFVWIDRGIVPATINHHDPDPACDLDYVPNEPREVRIDLAISNSFGFGGHNACLCVGRFR